MVQAVAAAGPSSQANSLLFVGDSLTYVNDLDRQVAALARAADSVAGRWRSLKVERSVQGGAPLRVLWKKTDARAKIASGKYDTVVLQEDLPETSVEAFQEYARRFVEHAKPVGATTILLMTWPYKRLDWIWTEGIAKAHWELAAQLGVRVAPAALAWARVQKDHPDIRLYDDDEEHPSLCGTYLTAAVLFATLWNQSPEGLKHTGSGSLKKVATILHQVAWDVVQSCRLEFGDAYTVGPQTQPAPASEEGKGAGEAAKAQEEKTNGEEKERPTSPVKRGGDQSPRGSPSATSRAAHVAAMFEQRCASPTASPGGTPSPRACQAAEMIARARGLRSDSPSSAGRGSPMRQPMSREALVAAVFEELDADKDGFLNSAECRVFEDFMGFHGDADDYAMEFAALCAELGSTVDAGIPLDGFGTLANVGTNAGLICTECTSLELRGLLAVRREGNGSSSRRTRLGEELPASQAAVVAAASARAREVQFVSSARLGGDGL